MLAFIRNYHTKFKQLQDNLATFYMAINHLQQILVFIYILKIILL